MWMRTIAIRQNSEAELLISITQQESGIARDTAAMREVTIAVADFGPPGQPKPGRFISPNAFNTPFKLIVLTRKHLLECLFTDKTLALECSTIEIADQPIRLIQHRPIDKPGLSN